MEIKSNNLTGLIYAKKNNKKKEDLKMGKILFDTYYCICLLFLGTLSGF